MTERYACSWIGNPTTPCQGQQTFDTQAAALAYERRLKLRSTDVKTVVWVLDEEEAG